jgi:heterodisulfide reductase subunit B
MRYLYYPGCSLEGSAREYDLATRTVMNRLGVELLDVADWTCCGATAAEAANHLLSIVLPARNLALAERIAPDDDLMVPCSACYLNLLKAALLLQSDNRLLATINSILAEEQLIFSGRVKVRHLLDVLATDIGAEKVAAHITHPLTDLTAAAYYGCQCVRPFGGFDDPESPTSMDALLDAAGVDRLEWSMGAKCCGASNANTTPKVGLALSGAILKAAAKADAIVTVCPMCQMNLEAYQKRISHRLQQDVTVTVVYLPQVLGLAMGMDPRSLGLNYNLAVTPSFKHKLAPLNLNQPLTDNAGSITSRKVEGPI